MNEGTRALPIDDADVAEAVLTRLHAKVVKYRTGRDMHPSTAAFYQLFAWHRMAVEVTAARLRIPAMNQNERRINCIHGETL